MNAARITMYIAAAIIVAILGAFAGWYVYVHKQVAATQATDDARGFGTAPSFNTPSYGGSTVAGLAADTDANTSTASTSPGNPAPRLWQIADVPVAGIGFSGSSTSLYFVERATG